MNNYSSGLPVLDVPPLIHRDLGAHLGSTSIAAVDYIAGYESSLVLATLLPNANTNLLFAIPIISPWFPCSIDQIQFEVTTAQASTEAYIGLFDNGDIQSPLQLGDVFAPAKTLFKSSAVATDSTGLKASAISPAVQLRPNRIYWLCLAVTAAASPATFRALSVGSVGHALGALASSANFNSALQMSSTTVAVLWGDTPVIPTVGWATVASGIPVLRYRLVA